ncbi:MAG: lytic transglycosylase domain-containing protein [Thermohalobaculum sp.]
MIAAALLACAANVAPVTLQAIIAVESGGNPLAINVNGLHAQPPPARTVAEAAQIVTAYTARGFSVDVGLMQVNSRNLPSLGLTIAEVLDPCTNIRSGGEILTANYAEAARSRGAGQPALQAALSAYNTGDFYRGFGNGYVARYYWPSGVPAIVGWIHPHTVSGDKPGRRVPPPNPLTADTAVFAREVSDVRIQ